VLRVLHTLRHLWSHPLNSGRRGRALLRWAAFQFARRTLGCAFLVPLAGPVRVVVEGGDHASLVVYAGLFDYQEMLLTVHLLRPGDLFVDVGANVGIYTLLASVAAGADTVAFEPVPAARRRLLEHVALHGAGNRVEVRPTAVGARPGRLRVERTRGALNRVVDAAPAGGGGGDESTVEVEAERLDAALRDRRPTVLKVDVEGYEAAVLEGAGDLLADPGLLAVLVELAGHGRRFGFDEDEIRRRLRDHGFEEVGYDPRSRSLVRTGRPSCANALFVRTGREVEERLRSAPPVPVPHARASF
jgi:FkbM family methyltransferase